MYSLCLYHLCLKFVCGLFLYELLVLSICNIKGVLLWGFLFVLLLFLKVGVCVGGGVSMNKEFEFGSSIFDRTRSDMAVKLF